MSVLQYPSQGRCHVCMPPLKDTAVVFQVTGCKARGAPPSDSKVKRGVTELITLRAAETDRGETNEMRPAQFSSPVSKAQKRQA